MKINMNYYVDFSYRYYFTSLLLNNTRSSIFLFCFAQSMLNIKPKSQMHLAPADLVHLLCKFLNKKIQISTLKSSGFNNFPQILYILGVYLFYTGIVYDTCRMI